MKNKIEELLEECVINISVSTCISRQECSIAEFILYILFVFPVRNEFHKGMGFIFCEPHCIHQQDLCLGTNSKFSKYWHINENVIPGLHIFFFSFLYLLSLDNLSNASQIILKLKNTWSNESDGETEDVTAGGEHILCG